MSSSPIRSQVLAFDVYGTILNTSGVNHALQTHLGIDEQKSTQLSLLWRRYQLEYTWRMNSMHIYEPFDIVTKNSLLHALAEHQIQANDELVAKLMAAYNDLSPFEDAIHALQKLANLSHVRIVIFSNGTQDMISSALKSASLAAIPDGLFLADEVKIYKPAKEIYRSLLAKVNAEGEDGDRSTYTGEDVWLVSGNPFDIAGARNAGLQAIWVDRACNGWMDSAVPLKPSKIVRSLEEIPAFMERAA